MTNNIQKLYKLAKIEATTIGCKNEDAIDCEGDCIDCTWYDEDEVYPPFTAEKQLKLIKWLAFEKRVSIKFINGKWYLYTAEMGIGSSVKYEPFEQLLAYFICNLWNDLTPEQKEEVRGILE